MTDWLAMEEKIRTDIAKGTRPHNIKMAILLLTSVCTELYNGSFDELLTAADSKVAENIRFSAGLRVASDSFGWKTRHTVMKILGVVRRILLLYGVKSLFVASLRIDHGVKLSAIDKLLRPHVKSFNNSDPSYTRLVGWVTTLKRRTKLRSDQSLRKFLSFVLGKVLPQLGVADISNIDTLTIETVREKLSASCVLKLCGDKTSNTTYLAWLKSFVEHILKMDITLDAEAVEEIVHIKRALDEDKSDRPAKQHRLYNEDLEKMRTAGEDDPLFFAVFIIMLTTGLRVGGVARILLADAISTIDGTTIVNEDFKTIEKRNKTVKSRFNLPTRVAVHTWVSNYRPASSSPYLFPDQQGISHVPTNRIRETFADIAYAAKLEGTHYHPHSMRHTFAHMCKEQNMSLDDLRDQLNHTSSRTTAKSYVDKSAKQTTACLNHPFADSKPPSVAPPVLKWIQGCKKAKRQKIIDDRHIENAKSKYSNATTLSELKLSTISAN
jgi:integrase